MQQRVRRRTRGGRGAEAEGGWSLWQEQSGAEFRAAQRVSHGHTRTSHTALHRTASHNELHRNGGGGGEAARGVQTVGQRSERRWWRSSSSGRGHCIYTIASSPVRLLPSSCAAERRPAMCSAAHRFLTAPRFPSFRCSFFDRPDRSNQPPWFAHNAVWQRDQADTRCTLTRCATPSSSRC